MIDSHDPPRTVRRDLELLSHDLASVYGTLSEIATVWRRAREDWPELPLRLPLQLQDATRQLAVSAQALVDAGPGQPPEVAFWLARRLSALRNDISLAQAVNPRGRDWRGGRRAVGPSRRAVAPGREPAAVADRAAGQDHGMVAERTRRRTFPAGPGRARHPARLGRRSASPGPDVRASIVASKNPARRPCGGSSPLR